MAAQKITQDDYQAWYDKTKVQLEELNFAMNGAPPPKGQQHVRRPDKLFEINPVIDISHSSATISVHTHEEWEGKKSNYDLDTQTDDTKHLIMKVIFTEENGLQASFLTSPLESKIPVKGRWFSFKNPLSNKYNQMSGMEPASFEEINKALQEIIYETILTKEEVNKLKMQAPQEDNPHDPKGHS